MQLAEDMRDEYKHNTCQKRGQPMCLPDFSYVYYHVDHRSGFAELVERRYKVSVCVYVCVCVCVCVYACACNGY